MPEWFEGYFAGLYADVLKGTFTPEASTEQAGIIARLLELVEGMSVLDVPCGAGRLAIPLALMGCRVTGVDLSESLVERARRHAKGMDVQARFIRGDMRKIEFDGEFDAAFNWFTSFGYFADDENEEFLRKVCRALVPGGRFAMEVINKPWLLANYKELTADEVAGVKIESRHTWDAAASRSVSETVFEKDGRRERHGDSIRIYSGGEVEGLLRRAGFAEVTLFSTDGATELSPASPRLVALALGGR